MHVFGQPLNLIKLTHHLCLFNINITLQRSWSTANAKQREKLLELIRRLAEDDKDGVMADKGKTLTLLFSLNNIKTSSVYVFYDLLISTLHVAQYLLSFGTWHTQVMYQSKLWIKHCLPMSKFSITGKSSNFFRIRIDKYFLSVEK